jgi:maltose alpha-D-glucosyltransferase/alpha-amylase
MSAFDADWLAARRWFRTKARPLAAVAVEDVAPLGVGGSVLIVLRAEHAGGGADRYLVPAVVPEGAAAREPADGDGTWRALVGAIAEGASAAAEHGHFRFEPTASLGALLPEGATAAGRLEERRLGVEQSNTSVRLGDRLILKVYRLLEPGTNPEVEVNAILTDRGFRWAPRLAGSGSWVPDEGEPATAVMLQELVPARGDGWAWMLASLSTPPQGPLEALAGVAQIAGITAEMHAALAARPERPGFPARPAERHEARAWREAADRELDAALAVLGGRERERLEAVSGEIRARFAAMEAAEGVMVHRIHGDYHLGQLLRTEEGFVVVDFEGEPGRPLAARRLPGSPLRDVAGMLRSLDYAVRTAEREGPDGFAHSAWLADARSSFVGAYGGEAVAHAALLAAFEAEKACYEVRYEANNRPGWTWLPIEALERLAR